MPFGLDPTTGQKVAAAIVTATIIGGAVKWASQILWKRGVAVHRFFLDGHDLLLDVRKQLGDNGGGTIQDSIQHLRDEIKIIVALTDAGVRPCLIFNPLGEISTVSWLFTEMSGWARADLEEGLWRLKLRGPNDQLSWNAAIAQQQAFAGEVTLAIRSRPDRRIRMVLKPIWSDAPRERRLIAYCAVFDARTQPRYLDSPPQPMWDDSIEDAPKSN